MTLKDLKPGDSGTILQVGGEGALRHRLLDMGLTPKTKVAVRKIAPMGDPIELSLRGYELTLRLEDAQKIEILPDDEKTSGNAGRDTAEKHHVWKVFHRERSGAAK